MIHAHRTAAGIRSLAALAALLATGCGIGGATTTTGGGPVPRCDTCVGEDGGPPAASLPDGATVGFLETSAPGFQIPEYLLHGTLPVPPGTFPRADGRDPLVLLDWNGTPLTTQTEIVTRYANEAEGASVVEVSALVHRDPASAAGAQVRYQIVQAPVAALPSAGSADLGDLLATEDLPASMQALLADPTAIEIAAYDCFGHKYACRPLDGSGNLKLMRHGRVTNELRIYQTMVPEPFEGGSTGTLPHFLGVHTYLSTMTGQEVLGFNLRFNNGSSGHDGQSALDNPLDKIYFQKIEVTLPPNLVMVQDFSDPFLGSFTGVGGKWVWELVKPLPANKMHVLRWQGQFHRRLWIGNASGGRAGSYAIGNGVGFCVPGTDALLGHEYWSWWNKGTARYWPQSYPLPNLDHVGAGNMRAQIFGQMTKLVNALANGTSDGDYPISSGVLGWGHPYGVSYGGMTSGSEIFMYDGVTTAASASLLGYRMYTALHRMQTDRMPTALYDLDGEPSSVERWRVENGNLDYVPFYCFLNPLLGGSYPDPFGLALAPRFQINYVVAHAMQPGYESQHLSFEPHDFQHYVRYTRSAKALVWLGNDSIAKDDLRMQAENFHLSFHSLRNEASGGYIGSGLRGQKNLVAGNPGQGCPFGRGEAWGLDCAVSAYACADPSWRARKRPWFDEIIEMLLDGQSSCTGFIQSFVSSKAVSGKYRARQQIEQSITENALQGLRETVYRDFDPGHSAMTRDVLVNSLYSFIGPMSWAPNAGPWRYTGIGPLSSAAPLWCSSRQMPSDAFTTGDIETYQDWSSFAYAYELTGDPIFLERAATQFGVPDLYMRLRNEGTNNLENRAALIALMQHLAASN